MTNIVYIIGCRNCLEADYQKHMTILQNEHNFRYNKTEYDVMLLVEKWKKEDNARCSFCGSDNLEISDIEVDDSPMYDYNYAVFKCRTQGENMMMINIDKSPNGIEMQLGGNMTINSDKNKLRNSLAKLTDILNGRPNETFKEHNIGNFLICLTGKFEDLNSVTVQRLRSAGISKNEILSALSPLLKNAGISH